MLDVGDLAPDFALSDQSGKLHRLKDYKGKKLVLYFYPKDETPGCTTEACGFRDAYADFRDLGVVVLGVSPDDAESHVRFAARHSLPFPLLSDPEKETLKAYGAWGKKKFMGKEYDGVLRTTFIIDENGKIKKIFRNVRPNRHEEAVLTSL